MGTSQISQFCIIRYLILQDILARIIYLELQDGLWVPDTSHLTSIKYTWWEKKQKAKKYIRDEDDDYVVVIYVFLHDRDPHFFLTIFYHQKIHVKPLSYAGSCDGAAKMKKIIVTELNMFIDRWRRQIKRIMAELDKSYAENSKKAPKLKERST